MPTPKPPELHQQILKLKVVPGASRDRIMGPLGDALKVAVCQPPEAGAANKAVVRLLADALGIPSKQIEIVRGQASPQKQVRIVGASPESLAALIRPRK